MEEQKKKGLTLFVIVLVLFALLAGTISVRSVIGRFKEEEKSEQTENKNKQLAEPEFITLDGVKYAYNDNIVTYLFIGTDATSDLKLQEKADFATGGDMADTLILAIFNKSKNQYGFYQLDRNTIAQVSYLNAAGDSGYEQICTAHWYGETEEERDLNTVDAVSGLLGGLKIDGYIKMNMEHVSEINDAIGGVTVNIKDDLTAIDPDFKEGANILLTDGQAERYLRARSGAKDPSNAARLERHKEYLQNAYNTVIGQLRENEDYAEELQKQIKGLTDTNISDNTIGKITNMLIKGDNTGIATLTAASGIDENGYEVANIQYKAVINQLAKTFDIAEYKGRIEQND